MKLLKNEKRKVIKMNRKKVRDAVSDRKGVTLIELIVTFALISLFVVLSCQVMASAMNLYHKIQGINYGRQVSDTLMDKIVGEIAGAQVGIKQVSGEGKGKAAASTEHSLIIDNSGNKIDLYDGSGSHIYITSDKYKNSDIKQLIIFYYRVETTEKGSEKKVIYEPVNWTFDEKAYLGYEIKELQFSLADPSGNIYSPNVIRIDLTLKHHQNKYGDYSATRYVECYNFQSEDELDMIIGPGKGDKEEPVDPPTPPVNPDSPDEVGDGKIYIHHNKDEVLNIKAAKNPYKKLYKESSDANTFIFPAGIYKENDTYYFFPKDVVVNKNDYKENDFDKLCNNDNMRNKCHIILDKGRIYTEEDAEYGWWKSGSKPSRGNIYIYQGRYYICNDEGASPNVGANPYGWVDVTSYVEIKNEN